MKAFKTKYLFKRSQRNRLPAFVLRRPKRGFNAPVAHWMTGELRTKFYDLTVAGAGHGSVFSPAFVAELWDEHSRRVQDHSLKLLALINFCLWCREYGIAGMPA
jgi:asparagine synthase (glutamine-hydrolysing)